jgi:hypothetical protein
MTVMGLIVGDMPGMVDIYQRLGKFKHAWGKDSDITMHSEFVDFDLENFGRKVVNII